MYIPATVLGTSHIGCQCLSHRKKAIPMAESCKGCVYWRNIGGDIRVCHYMLDTGEKRESPAANCNKRKTGSIAKHLQEIKAGTEKFR